MNPERQGSAGSLHRPSGGSPEKESRMGAPLSSGSRSGSQGRKNIDVGLAAGLNPYQLASEPIVSQGAASAQPGAGNTTQPALNK